MVLAAANWSMFFVAAVLSALFALAIWQSAMRDAPRLFQQDESDVESENDH